MRRYYYDLHVHSCLSPCGDNDNTPNNIAGMASLCGLDIVALTDHNTAKNCPAFFAAAEKYGIIPIAGMELTTSEDIHVVCLFETLPEALEFDQFIETKRIRIKNKPQIFGEQLILDSDDNVIGQEENLLSNATVISIDEVKSVVEEFNGICYPAHIDRFSNGIIAILGTIPSDSDFTVYEVHSKDKIEGLANEHSINPDRFVVSSDAHYLTDMRDKENFFTLSDERDKVVAELFEFFRRKL